MTQWTHKYGFSLETLPERIAVTQGASQFTIGIPLEISSNENRVAIVPHSVKPLVMKGHRVPVQTGPALRSNYDDHDYREAGAELVMSKKEVFKSDIMLKIAHLTLSEIALLYPNSCRNTPHQDTTR